jgi:hypothetical protein
MAIDVELFTMDHVIRGSLESSGERMSDLLNEKNEIALIMKDVQIVRLLGIGKTPPILLPKARIEKSAILFARPAEQDLTHKSIYRRASRQEFDIVLLLQSFELKGTIHLIERIDMRRGLSARVDHFIALTDASATYTLFPQIAIHSSTIVFNKNQVVLFGEPRQKLMDQRLPAEE